jgi:single-stranded-DNA-specific exonuclease
MRGVRRAVVPGRGHVTRTRVRPRWLVAEPPAETAVAALAAELKLPHSVCRLLCVRGFDRPDPAKLYLRPSLDQLHEPLLIPDMQPAVERLARAIRTGETVFLHGDYDVDGISSVSLLTRALRDVGGRVVPFIPNRLRDGYDLGDAGVRAARAAGASVVVTCDCGTNALEAISRLCGDGVDVIVTDHHLPSGPIPDCLAVLNPRRLDSQYPDRDLAAVGVAFKLALAITRELQGNENRVWGMLDLVALATVADVAPLRGENRVFVQRGLRLMKETRNIGLAALIRSSGLEGKPITAGRVGFILAPRLNAAGRMGDAMRGVELLLSESEAQANTIARELEEMNLRRQDVDRRTLDEAREELASSDLESIFGVVLAREGWHPGVIGIVASRLVEEFGRPTLLIALDGEVGKGSGRSIPPFDLHAALTGCRDLLMRYGGHRAAAGVTVARDRIPELAERFNGIAAQELSSEDLAGHVRVDLDLPIDEAREALETLLRYFEPFGVGNPSPLFLSRGVRSVLPPRVIGRDGVKLGFDAGGRTLQAVGWGMAERMDELTGTEVLDVVYRLERDEYRGTSTIQARLVDFAPAG